MDSYVRWFDVLYPKDPTVKVTRETESISFEWKQEPASAWILLFFGLFFEACGVASLLAPQFPPEAQTWGSTYGVFTLTTSVFALLVYGALHIFLNRTRIRASRSSVERTNGPIPLQRSLALHADGIQQFFALGTTSSKSSSYSYGSVYAIDRDGLVRLIAKNLPSGFAASQICHELEDFYGIEDMEVYGVTTDPSHPGPRT